MAKVNCKSIMITLNFTKPVIIPGKNKTTTLYNIRFKSHKQAIEWLQKNFNITITYQTLKKENPIFKDEQITIFKK